MTEASPLFLYERYGHRLVDYPAHQGPCLARVAGPRPGRCARCFLRLCRRRE